MCGYHRSASPASRPVPAKALRRYTSDYRNNSWPLCLEPKSCTPINRGGFSVQHPFGGVAITKPYSQVTHRFASRPRDRFTFSRMLKDQQFGICVSPDRWIFIWMCVQRPKATFFHDPKAVSHAGDIRAAEASPPVQSNLCRVHSMSNREV
jgi:hypothetical protein